MKENYQDVGDTGFTGLLAARHRMLVEETAHILELDTGLSEAIIPTHYACLVSELAAILDLDAGLAAIVPSTDQEVADRNRQLQIVGPDEELVLGELLRVIATASPAVRLALRAGVHVLERAIVLGVALGHHHREVDDHYEDEAEILCAAGKDGRDGDHSKLRVRVDSGALVNPFVDLVERLAGSPHLPHEIHRAAIGFALATRDLNKYNDVAEFAATVHRLLHDMYAIISALADSLARSVGFDRQIDVPSDMAKINGWAHGHLVERIDDFSGADLSSIDLSTVLLDGVRWSMATRWPQRWIETIKRNSVDLGNGLYEIGPDVAWADNTSTLTRL